ncbi:hypothetical protein ACFRCG_41835 [Embleya sp. NPDC056575]|uniref:hypothetical protein n=1 Tax=unclassified Embleya TaxID=2699296 RepID=UPI0036B1F524
MQRITRLTHAPGTLLGYVNGRPIYPIAGGSGEGEEQGGTGEQNDTGGAADTDADADKDWKAEAQKWQALSKKHEARSKENADAARERDELRKQSLSDTERAVEEAKAAGRSEATTTFRSKIGRHAIAAAAAEARVVVPAAALDLMDLSSLTDDQGEVDADKVAALVTGFAPATQQQDERRHVTAGQGPRSSSRDRSTGSVAAGRDLYAERHNKT